MNEHWTVVFVGRERAFLKEGHVEPSPQWVRDEKEVYESVRGAFMPELLGFEDGEHPLLVLEDLTPGGRWPPPWPFLGLGLATREWLERSLPHRPSPGSSPHSRGSRRRGAHRRCARSNARNSKSRCRGHAPCSTCRYSDRRRSRRPMTD